MSSPPTSISSMVPLPVPCHYPRCNKRFANENDMKRHKHYTPDHHYCRKCDYDAKDWHDLLDHKVASMAASLLGDRRHEHPKKMKHLVCEYCGMNFKTMRGRADHRRQFHPATQYIVCQACGPEYDENTRQLVAAICGQVFLRPSHLIEHYEKGRCHFITANEFRAERQHKHIIKQILAEPDVFTGIIGASRAMIDGRESYEADSTGLLDDASSSTEADAFQTLVPRVKQPNLMDQSISLPIDPARQYSLPARAFRAYSTSAESSGSNSTPSLSGADGSESGSEASTSTIQDQHDEGRASVGSSQVTIASYLEKLPTIAESIDWAAIRRTRELNARLAGGLNDGKAPMHKSNLFNSRWYDPHSITYNPDLFWHTILELYKCPFASCGYECPNQVDIERHLHSFHVNTKIKCPTCCRIFSTVTALLKHFEASVRGSRCWIANTKHFRQVLNDVTGGFIDIERTSDTTGENLLAGYIETSERVEKVERQVGAGAGVSRGIFSGVTPEGFAERRAEIKGLIYSNEHGKVEGDWADEVPW